MLSFISHRGLQWYDLVFLGLACVAVYPDRTLEFLYQHWNLTFTTRRVIATALTALLLMVGFSLLLVAIEADRFFWWRGAASIGFFAGYRMLRSFISDILGIRDD